MVLFNLSFFFLFFFSYSLFICIVIIYILMGHEGEGVLFHILLGHIAIVFMFIVGFN